MRGRTQRRSDVPQRMDLGHGKLRITSGIRAATASEVATPGLGITAKKTSPFLSERISSSSLVRPVERRKPSSAFSGASTRGPLRSSSISGVRAGRPGTCSTRRRGVEWTSGVPWSMPASFSPFVTISRRVSRAPGCIRAGISSERISSRRSGMGRGLWATGGRLRYGMAGRRVQSGGAGFVGHTPHPVQGAPRQRPGSYSPNTRAKIVSTCFV